MTKCDELMEKEPDLPSSSKKRKLEPHPSNVVEHADSQETLPLSPSAGRVAQLRITKDITTVLVYHLKVKSVFLPGVKAC